MSEFESKEIGKGVMVKFNDKTLKITIDLTKRRGLSGSGKSETIATTSGNADLGDTGIKLGLNCYIPK